MKREEARASMVAQTPGTPGKVSMKRPLILLAGARCIAEELRVSVFAQTPGTPGNGSTKRPLILLAGAR